MRSAFSKFLDPLKLTVINVIKWCLQGYRWVWRAGGGYKTVLGTALSSLQRTSILLLETNLVTIYVMFEKAIVIQMFV